MKYKNSIVLFFIVIAIVCFISCFTSMLHAQDVILAIGNSAGYPGLPGDPIEVAMNNPSKGVRSVQMDIVDDGDYLTCIACTPDQSRTADFTCVTNELEGGGCRVVLIAISTSIIVPGEGPILTLSYSGAESAPAGDCINLIPESVIVTDSNNRTLEVVSHGGEFCFTVCQDSGECNDGNVCTTDNCDTSQCVHECNAFHPLDSCCANQACLLEPLCTGGDYDGDGISDDDDNCPYTSNNLQENSDDDSHGDACDNCLTTDNENQADSDGDNIGDICDQNCGDVWPAESFPGAMDCGDGTVDLFDILKAIDIILYFDGVGSACQMKCSHGDVPNGMPPYCGNPPGDPNCECDGDIDVFDILVIIDTALGKANCCDYCRTGEIY